ncbi:glycosyltransferase family A protein [Paenibacillus pinistramenti]|uniref:glycosyltransferase family A protein n=1 Tax=Paenibacillus pinistramenti TaxID=1768003 RepID=UPI0013969DE9|nr:glycosyltransferase family A protein [Paenibacillus pinistramenti]
MNKIRLSIITPAFNRGYILHVLYESLLRQSSRQFEWIVVDDGSADNTKELVEGWQQSQSHSGGFEIVYIRQDNGGKHRALNRGIPQAKYDYIYIVDSDDYLVPDAVDKICQWIGTVDGKPEFAGVSGLWGHSADRPAGQYPAGKPYVDATNLQRKRFKLLGDKSEIYRRDLLLSYPFPEFENEKFLGEAAVWDRIAGDGYKLRWFGEVICIGRYLDDGLTRNNGTRTKLDNFSGYTFVEKQNAKLRRFPDNYLAVGRYIGYARMRSLSYSEIRATLEISRGMLLGGLLLGLARTGIKKLNGSIKGRKRGLES